MFMNEDIKYLKVSELNRIIKVKFSIILEVWVLNLQQVLQRVEYGHSLSA